MHSITRTQILLQSRNADVDNLLIAVICKAMIQTTERIMSTKELVVQMATAFFPSGPHFWGQFTPLYFAKIATALAFSNRPSPDFYLSKYAKMSKWRKSA